MIAGGQQIWLDGPASESEGYDLRGVMVGSEGTLGIVTKIALKLRRKPEAVKTLLASFSGVFDAGKAVTTIIEAGILPVALELMDKMTVQAVEAALHPGFPTNAGAVLLVETEGVIEGLGAEMDQIQGDLQPKRFRNEASRKP